MHLAVGERFPGLVRITFLADSRRAVLGVVTFREVGTIDIEWCLADDFVGRQTDNGFEGGVRAGKLSVVVLVEYRVLAQLH